MLSIPETTVRARAHAALDALARADQTPPAAAAGPSAGDGARATTLAASERTRSEAPAGEHFPAATPSGPSPARQLPSSRLGGALLLGAIVVAAVVVAVVLGGGKGSGGGSANTHAASTSPASTTATSSTSAKIENKLALAPLEPESSAAGEAYVLSDGSRHAFYVAAKNLPPSKGFFYAVWLYNSPSSSAPLGRAPSVGSNGRLEGGGPLPSNAADYAKLVVTRETSTHAAHPGQIVLSGNFALR